MDERALNFVKNLTLEEKCSLLSGMDSWHTQPLEGLESVALADGPHGVRVDPGHNLADAHATCFPSAAALASTWDRSRLEDVGKAIAEEALAKGIGVVLGPGANIKRSPLCGRNFEYYSEDPFLSGQMAKSFINGLQSKGIGASLKHFACNNQETRRMSIDAEMDERTLREIYLPAFETAVKEAKPWTVMCAYNKINGSLCSENKRLLSDILRGEWGYEGLVMSDWGAVRDRVSSLEAGLDLEMPGGFTDGDNEVLRAVKSGQLSEAVVDECASRVAGLVFKCLDNAREAGDVGALSDRRHMLARRVAAEGMVLLKNQNQVLPLVPAQRVTVIGELAREPRYCGGGSSKVLTGSVDVPLDEIRGFDPNTFYAKGYNIDGSSDPALLKQAVEAARKCDVAVVFAGLSGGAESEGFDREDLLLPANQNELISAVASACPKTVVVLMNGAPVELGWVDKVAAILEVYLGGQAVGGALADVLYGIKEPSGRLAETFPLRLEDTPCFTEFPGGREKSRYGEGIYVGYRHYDKRLSSVLFPFGYGLGYSTYAYSGLEIRQEQNSVSVSLTVTNTGSRTGRPVVQLYVAPMFTAAVSRPVQELKGFEKRRLTPGESAVVSFELDARSFSYYAPGKGWVAERGEYELRIGESSRGIMLRCVVSIPGENAGPKYGYESTIKDFLDCPKTHLAAQALVEQAKAFIGEAYLLEMTITAASAFSQGVLDGQAVKDLIALANS